MPQIDLTDAELRIVQRALHAYLAAFGHDEADVLRELKHLATKLSAAGPTSADTPRSTAG